MHVYDNGITGKLTMWVHVYATHVVDNMQVRHCFPYPVAGSALGDQKMCLTKLQF